jgi:hypothetical protein
MKDYFQRPPSNVASQSPGTTLYGTLTRRLVNTAPLARLVKSGLPGVSAHLNEVRDCVGTLKNPREQANNCSSLFQ